MKIGSYIILRIFSFIFQIIGAISLIFVIFNLIPYDPVAFILWNNPPSSAAEAEFITQLIRSSWGLDLPIHIQVFRFIKGLVLEGSLGNSWLLGPINFLLARQVPYTFTIFIFSFLAYTTLSILLGVFVASHERSNFAKIIKIITSLGYAIPYFVIAIFVIFLAADSELIIAGNLAPTFVSNIRYLLFPTVIIIVAFTSYQMKLVHSEMRNILSQNYIRTARAKGLPERVVIYKHGLRNSIPQIITSTVVTMPLAITSIVVIETLFGIPGLGNTFVWAADKADWGVLIGFSTAFLILNGIILMTSDIINVAINPRSEG